MKSRRFLNKPSVITLAWRDVASSQWEMFAAAEGLRYRFAEQGSIFDRVMYPYRSVEVQGAPSAFELQVVYFPVSRVLSVDLMQLSPITSEYAAWVRRLADRMIAHGAVMCDNTLERMERALRGQDPGEHVWHVTMPRDEFSRLGGGTPNEQSHPLSIAIRGGSQREIPARVDEGPRWPLFVLIGDETTLMRRSSDDELQWFEQPDVENEPHWCWDREGALYRLVWDGERGRVACERWRAEDRKAFVEVAAWCVQRMLSQGKRPERHVLRPAALRRKIERMMMRWQ